MNIKTLEDLKDILCKELGDIVKNGVISHSELDTVSKLTETIKNVMKIREMDEDGYSYGRGEWVANGNYTNRGSMYDNNKMSGRMHYVRGHYSHDGEDMITKRIEEMLEDNSLNTEERNTLRRAMDIMK